MSKRTSGTLSILIYTLCMSEIVFANQAILTESEHREMAIIEQAVITQKRISQSSKKALKLQAQIEKLQAEQQALEVYQTHLNGMIDSQEQERNSLNTQLSEIDDTRKSIIPLMYAMLKGLEASIVDDKPIRYQTRIERIKKLKAIMPKADISDAEKYRRILETFQIEVDYGSKMGRYSAPIHLNGTVRETEQLYLGRVSLVARSLDRQHYWSWNSQSNQWQALKPAIGFDIDKAFSMADQKIAPSLLHLPVSLTTVLEAN